MSTDLILLTLTVLLCLVGSSDRGQPSAGVPSGKPQGQGAPGKCGRQSCAPLSGKDPPTAGQLCGFSSASARRRGQPGVGASGAAEEKASEGQEGKKEEEEEDEEGGRGGEKGGCRTVG